MAQANPQPAKHRRYRVAIVGCGRVARFHIRALRHCPAFVPVLLYDIDPERAQKLAAETPGLRIARHLEDLLENPSVDVVAICTPPATHAEIAVRAASAGKALYIEKPLALNRLEAETIVSAVHQAGVPATVGYNLRSHRLVMKARQLLDRRELGHVELARTIWTTGPHASPLEVPWRQRRATGGGGLIEIATHHIDLWYYLLGSWPVELSAISHSGAFEDQTLILQGRLQNGTLVSTTISLWTAETNEIELYGRDAVLRFSCFDALSFNLQPRYLPPGSLTARLNMLKQAVAQLPQAIRALRSGGGFLASYTSHWQRFADQLEGDAPPPCPLEEGLRVVQIMEAALRSIQTGKSIALPSELEASPARFEPEVHHG